MSHMHTAPATNASTIARHRSRIGAESPHFPAFSRSSPHCVLALFVAVLALLGSVVPAFAQTAVVMPEPKIQFFDNNGDPLNGGKLYSYLPGTTTPLETCSSSTLVAGACSAANTNPVILDSAGRASVFLRPQVYKFILQTSASVQIWSQDNVTSTQYLGTGTASTGTFLRGDYSWARLRTVVTTTSTGTQTNFDPGIVGDTVILANNATALTINGFAPAIAQWDGQRITVISKGAGQVNFSHQVTSTAGNRLINTITTADTPLAAGFGTAEYVYDATTARWRLVRHDQGAPIAYTPTWTASSVNPVLNNGSLSAIYFLRGTQVSVSIVLSLGNTTTIGTGNYSFSLPITATPTGQLFTYLVTDASPAAFYTGIGQLGTVTTITMPVTGGATLVGAGVPITWTTSDSLQISGTYQVL